MTVEPIRRPTAWRLMTAAFLVWSANFLIGYAAALLSPEHHVTKVLLVALALASIPALYWIIRQSRGLMGRQMVRVGAVIAGLAILFNGAVAIA